MARTVVTVSNALIGAVLDGIALSESESRTSLHEVGLSFDTVRDIHGRTSIVRLARLWRRVMRRTEDDFIGLRIGTSVRPDRFGLAVHAAQHGTDFRTVLVQFAKYATLVNDLIECKLDDARPLARFTARLHWNVLKLERHAVDLTFAATITWAHQNLDAAPGLREVRLKHGLTGSRARYERIFAAPIVFNASHDQLVFDAAYLDAPVRERNPELGCILERFASQEIADGLPALATVLASLAKQGSPIVYDRVHRILGEGNFVLAASEGRLGRAPTAYYDLFRLERGKIVEHWDVIETIPARETWANQNGKF